MRQNPYAFFLDQVEKPARYIGGEHFSSQKDWNDAFSRVALCFPDTYEIGMSHLGFKILYDELNRDPRILADRVFAPWTDCEELIRKHELPLVTLEQFRPLNEFHILGFSLQYEMTYTNILNMLDLGGVSIWTKDRREEEPFVICGGPCATHPEPLAPFVDFVVIGDGESLFNRLALFIAEARAEGQARHEILKALDQWPGIYVPSLYEVEEDELTGFEVVKTERKFERFFVENLKDYPIPTKTPIPHMTAIFDRYSVELARGCTEGCRFCQAGMIYRPVRERRPTDVIYSVMEGMKEGGFNEASLTCLSTADYSAITPMLLELLDKVQGEKATLGISSLRAYGLDKRIFDKMAEVKNTSLTFAPEAGTQRMRNVINKNISEDDLMETARDVFSRGWKKMKLYFMIGLPTETDEDVKGIMYTSGRAKSVAKKTGCKGPQITVSASTFVPKPHTPFQWAAMIPLSEIERKQSLLKDMAMQFKLNFRKHLSRTSFIEGLVARGDRKVANVIFDAWKEGARFDGWNETFDYGLWTRCIEANNIDLAQYLGTIRMDGRLPWDHIDVGLEDKFLSNEWKRAVKDRLSPPCGKPNKEIVHYTNIESLDRAHIEQKKKLVCYNCGVACDLQGMVDERKEYLTSLKAFKDEPYVKPEVSAAELKQKRQVEGSNENHFRYRVSFSKLGPISFISHLDLQKIMARIFKRAGVDVSYSYGFNPRPQLSFGPALTLGVSSLTEFFDVKVPRLWKNTDDILKRLQENSERGIMIKDIELLATKADSIQEAANYFQYYIPAKNTEKAQSLAKEWDQLEEILIESYSKKTKSYKPKDIRPLISGVQFGHLDVGSEIAELIRETEVGIDQGGIFVTTQVKQGSSIRPSELVSWLKDSGLDVGRPVKTAVMLR